MSFPSGLHHRALKGFWADPRRRDLILLIGRAALLLVAAAALVWTVMALIGDMPRTTGGGIDFAAMMGSARDTAWAPFIVMAVFILLNFAGAPQFLLIGATVVVFGIGFGFLYAWTATMVSSCMGFWLGHFFGGELLRRFAGHRTNEFSRMLGRHGIFASAAVRFVPGGPALLVNMAAGVSHISFSQFTIGAALGVAPKVLIIAVVGKGLSSFASNGNVVMLVAAAALLGVWAAVLFYARKQFNRWRQEHMPTPPTEERLDEIEPVAILQASVEQGGERPVPAKGN